MWSRLRRPGRAAAPRALAVVTPLPPAQTGIAAYTVRLLDAIAQQREVHVYADGLDGAPVMFRSERLHVHEIGELADGGPDMQRLFCLGNSPFHVGAWERLRALGGDVLLHEATLWGLYHGLAERGLLGAGGLAERVRAVDGATFEEAMAAPSAMVSEVVASARRILVHTQTARRLVLERHPDTDARVVSFALPAPAAAPARAAEPVVASFGHQRAAQQVVDAYPAIAAAVPGAQLWLVGREFSSGQFERLRGELRERGLDGRATFTGWVGDAEYHRRMAATAVGIQPRPSSYGERSAALGDLLSAGVPTVVNDASHAEGVPRDALVVADGATAGDLAAAAIALLGDPARRERIGGAAIAYAAGHGAERAAADVLAALGA